MKFRLHTNCLILPDLYSKMGITKNDKFNAAQNRLAKITKAMGDPARIAIIEVLLKRNECICGDLVDEEDDPDEGVPINSGIYALGVSGVIYLVFQYSRTRK